LRQASFRKLAESGEQPVIDMDADRIAVSVSMPTVATVPKSTMQSIRIVTVSSSLRFGREMKGPVRGQRRPLALGRSSR
jgi:hypothetical protein